MYIRQCVLHHIEERTYGTPYEDQLSRVKLEELLLALWFWFDILEERRLTRQDVGSKSRAEGVSNDGDFASVLDELRIAKTKEGVDPVGVFLLRKTGQGVKNEKEENVRRRL